MKTSKSFITILLTTIFLVLATPMTTKAVEFVNGETIPKDVTIDDDVFIAGNSVVVDGSVNGDLFAAGNAVTVNGNVNGSLFVAAQTIFINGKVTGSIYGASSAMILGEDLNVGRNVYYAGFSLDTRSGSQISRDLIAAGYQVILSGKVSRDVVATVYAFHLNGEIGGDLKLEVGPSTGEFSNMIQFITPPGVTATVASGLHIGEEAKIGGLLTYTSEEKQSSSINSQPLGGVVYRTPQPSIKPSAQKPPESVVFGAGRWFLARLRELATLLILGGLALWLIPNYLYRWVERARIKPLPSAGWGFITIIIGYAAAFMLALSIIALAIFLGVVTMGGLAQTVFGLGFSALSFGFTIFSLFVSYVSKLVVAYLVGKLLLQRFAPESSQNRVLPLLTGVVIYILIRAIPIIGWLIALAVTVIGFGAIWLVLREGKLQTQPGSS